MVFSAGAQNLKLRHCQRPPNFWDPTYAQTVWPIATKLVWYHIWGVECLQGVSHAYMLRGLSTRDLLHAQNTVWETTTKFHMSIKLDVMTIFAGSTVICLLLCYLCISCWLHTNTFVIVESQRHRQLVKVLTWRTCTFASITLLFYLIA